MAANESIKDILARLPEFTDDPVERLDYTLKTYNTARDDEWVIIATSNVHGDGKKTGLTWGDLRSIKQFIDDWYPGNV